MAISVKFRDEIAARIQASGLIAVIILEDVESAVPLAQALLDGGIDVIELALRTPAALPAISLMKAKVPGMTVGAGTVLSPLNLSSAREAGADFAVSPGVNRDVLEAASRSGFSFAPGVATPSDIESALACGCKMLKFFPVEQIGGLRYFDAVTAPYEHLGIKYIPLGGLTEEKIPAYLGRPQVAALGGTWMASRELIASRDWPRITSASARAMEVVRKIRTGGKAA